MKRTIYSLVAIGLFLNVGCGVDLGAPATQTEKLDEGVETSTAELTTRPTSLVPEVCLSNYREPNTSWTVYRDACMKALLAIEAQTAKAAGPMANATAGPCPMVMYGHIPAITVDSHFFDAVPIWSDDDILAQFKITRDTRYLYATGDPNFLRRISWLYPDNGCFARAELAAAMAAESGLEKPYKLFSFGELRVASDNVAESANGIATWGWHVVPVVRRASDHEAYVLDAAIDATRPLHWQEWVRRQREGSQNDPLTEVGVAVAHSNIYIHTNLICDVSAPPPTDTARISMRGQYLGQEWERQGGLQRNPSLLLGDYPPWGVGWKYYVISADEPALVISSCVACRGAEILSPRCLADCP